MTYRSDPSTAHPSRAQRRAGYWTCPECDCENSPDDDQCWNCDFRPVPQNEHQDE